jgi:hypothetical protein
MVPVKITQCVCGGLRPEPQIQWVQGPFSGSFEFVKFIDRNEEYPPGKIRNIIYGMWAFEETLTEFPSFSASQMTDALMWADKTGTRAMRIYEGYQKPQPKPEQTKPKKKLKQIPSTKPKKPKKIK